VADPLAVYGAVIGTTAAAGALWNIYHGWWRDRARLQLTCWCDGNKVYLKAVNVGRRPITLEELGICFRGREEPVTCRFLGVELQEGKAFTRLLEILPPDGPLKARGSPCHVFATDSAGKRARRQLSGKVIECVKGQALEEPSPIKIVDLEFE
jgi:hypothetical protein